MEVINWDKYNARTDSVRPQWFKLDNSLATSQSFFELDCDQKWLWVTILSLVSQKNGDPIIWSSRYITAITKISPKRQDETIDIFEKFVRLRVSRASAVRDSHLEERRGEEKRREESNAHFDLESLYQKFPRKMGKAEGLKKLRKEIQSQDDFDAVAQAIDRFKAHHSQTDPKFIPYFSTFTTTWKDWLDPNTGSGPEKPVRDYSFLGAAK